MTRETALARTLVQLADTLVADFDIVELLTVVTDRCVGVLDVDAAGIVLASPDGDLRSMASSSEQMHLLDLFALVVEEGPGLDCYRTGMPVVNQDVASANGRWPRLAERVLADGYHSVHALPLRLRGTVIGALNLLRRAPATSRPRTSTRPRPSPTSPRSPSSSTAPWWMRAPSTISSATPSTRGSSSSRRRA